MNNNEPGQKLISVAAYVACSNQQRLCIIFFIDVVSMLLLAFSASMNAEVRSYQKRVSVFLVFTRAFSCLRFQGFYFGLHFRESPMHPMPMRFHHFGVNARPKWILKSSFTLIAFSCKCCLKMPGFLMGIKWFFKK